MRYMGCISRVVCLTAMVELPGVVVMAKSDITSPHVHQRISHFMAGRKADVIMRSDIG